MPADSPLSSESSPPSSMPRGLFALLLLVTVGCLDSVGSEVANQAVRAAEQTPPLTAAEADDFYVQAVLGAARARVRENSDLYHDAFVDRWPEYQAAVEQSSARIEGSKQVLKVIAPAGAWPLDDILEVATCAVDPACEPATTTFLLPAIACFDGAAAMARGLPPSFIADLNGIRSATVDAFLRRTGATRESALVDCSSPGGGALGPLHHPTDGRGDLWIWESQPGLISVAPTLARARDVARALRLGHEELIHTEFDLFPALATRDTQHDCSAWQDALGETWDRIRDIDHPTLQEELADATPGSSWSGDLVRTGLVRLAAANRCAADIIDREADKDPMLAAALVAQFPGVLAMAAERFIVARPDNRCRPGDLACVGEFEQVFGNLDSLALWDVDPHTGHGRAYGRLAARQRRDANVRKVTIGVAAISAIAGVGALGAGALGLSLGATVSSGALVAGLGQASTVLGLTAVGIQAWDVANQARIAQWRSAAFGVSPSPAALLAFAEQKRLFVGRLTELAANVAAEGLAIATPRLIARYRGRRQLAGIGRDDVAQYVELLEGVGDADVTWTTQFGYLVIRGQSSSGLTRLGAFRGFAKMPLGQRLLRMLYEERGALRSAVGFVDDGTALAWGIGGGLKLEAVGADGRITIGVLLRMQDASSEGVIMQHELFHAVSTTFDDAARFTPAERQAAAAVLGEISATEVAQDLPWIKEELRAHVLTVYAAREAGGLAPTLDHLVRARDADALYASILDSGGFGQSARGGSGLTHPEAYRGQLNGILDPGHLWDPYLEAWWTLAESGWGGIPVNAPVLPLWPDED